RRRRPAGRERWTDRRGGAFRRRQGLRLHWTRRRALARLRRIGLLRILCLGIARAGMALVRILGIGLLLVRHCLATAGHARGWPRRRPEQGFERIAGLRRSRNP